MMWFLSLNEDVAGVDPSTPVLAPAAAAIPATPRFSTTPDGDKKPAAKPTPGKNSFLTMTVSLIFVEPERQKTALMTA